MKEIDARFAASSGYKPGQKLDPNDPTDKTMIPVWLDIQAKVKAEDAAGTLVLTYDHPIVTQSIAEAHAASQTAAQHLDAAASAPDPATAQQHMEAAAHHADVAAQKTAAAAAVQPPTASPEITQAASQAAAQQPKHEYKHGHQHVAQAQAEAAGNKVAQTQADASSPDAAPAPEHAHIATPRSILDRETDARFWSSGYRPGQKLDPHNPNDAKMIPIWLDIFNKVQAEDAAGNLVLTYNNPVVAQHLADAHVADQAAAMQLDAAAAAPPHEVPQHVAGAATAAQISAQKAHEAAKIQPPSISPQIAHAAAQAVRRAPPPPPHAPARDHIAHMQAQGVGHRAAKAHHHHHHARRGRRVKSTVHPGSLQNYRAEAAHLAHEAGAPFVLVIRHPDGSPEHRAFGSRAELDAAYAQLSEQHDQYKYVAAFDLAANPSAPVLDSVGIPAAEHVEAPASEDAGHGHHHHQHGADPTGAAPPTEEAKPGWSTGQKIAAALVAIGAVGGLVYMSTRKSSGKPSGATRRALAASSSPSAMPRLGRGIAP